MIGQRFQVRPAPAALRRAVAAVASFGPDRRRAATGSAPLRPYVWAVLALILTAGYAPVLLIAADRSAGWTAWRAVTVLLGMVAVARIAGGSPGRRSGPRRSGRLARVAHVPAQVIREPESRWWDAHKEPGETAVTVAVVGESATPGDTEAVVSRLAELAVNDELLVVYGSGPRSGAGHQAVLAGLRRRLPRHHVVALLIPPGDGALPGDVVAAAELLEEGSLPVVVTPAAAVHNLAAGISSYLRADRVLRVSPTTTGADLYQVWRRQASSAH